MKVPLDVWMFYLLILHRTKINESQLNQKLIGNLIVKWFENIRAVDFSLENRKLNYWESIFLAAGVLCDKAVGLVFWWDSFGRKANCCKVNV